MKIYFCIGNMLTGGAERVIANLSNYLIKKNDVTIIATTAGMSYKLDKNVKHIILDDKYKTNFVSRTISRIKKLRNILKENRPDVVVSFLPEPSYRLMIAKQFLNIKTIISVRNDPNVEYNNFFKKIVVEMLYSKANGFVFQTEDAKKWFSKKIQHKSIVIPNPINEKYICKPYNGKRNKTIVNVGRLTEQKNQKLLIDSFSELSNKYKDYILKIYGEGNLKEELQEQIDKLKLSEKVFLMGKSDNIKDEIYKEGVFVLTSNYEGMPNALMEAMALGLPCIATDCPIGGPKYLIKNKKNGILVSVNNKKEIVKAITFIIDNPDYSKKIGNEANKICEILNPNKIMSEWEKYIEKILDGD